MPTDSNAPEGEPDALAADTRIGDFRLRGRIGAGAMGEVYLAQDVVLGRRVALKLIRRDVVAHDGLTRFLDEARATASFSHPHIVTLYAVGEHDGRPYLALEYLDGESLRARCPAAGLPEREVMRIVRAIAEAVTEAHARGVIHADLKPDNVMMPRDGRLRVVDFGLARLNGARGATASGTPSYMAPERWTGAPPTGAIDVWALGVMLFELGTGLRPWTDDEVAGFAYGRADPPLPPLATAWASVARACLVRAPERRPTAAQLAERLTALLEPARAAEATSDCPFPGLVAFGRDDAAHYFGRAAELDAVVEALRRHPLVPIAGPSGVGKSSFVTAALAPRVDEHGGWTVVACRPGATPFAAVAEAIEYTDARGLREEPTRLALALAAFARRRARSVLLIVDQFEECFTLAGAEGVALCAALAEAARQDEPWRIILTVRDDFLARLASAPAVRPHLAALVVLAPMSRDDLRAAVRGPLANVGYATDADSLAGRIATDVVDQPAALALLQFACRGLWERRDVDRRLVRAADYEAIGGASGALAAHGERVLVELTPGQVRQVRAVFLALVGPDGTRRPQRRLELESLAGGSDAIVNRLLDRRLIVATRQPETDDVLLELAHEALTTAWPRLARWLDETHEERLLVAEVEQAATRWSRRGEEDEETWTGVALADATRKVEAWSVALPGLSRRFLDAGVARTSRARRRRRWLFGTVGSVLVAATTAAAIAAFAFARSSREARAKTEQVLAQQTQIKLAAADMGRFELVLEPYDWDPVRQLAQTPTPPPALSWRLRALGEADVLEPGREYVADNDVHRGTPRWNGSAWLEIVEARSGRVFLEVARGTACAPSLLLIQRLPGFTERDSLRSIHVKVPTCAAALSTMVEIPAGEFWRNVDEPDGVHTRDALAYLPTFWIDRTEVTRGAFAMYEAMYALSGDRAAAPRYLDRLASASLEIPVVGVSYLTARAYCRYMGKDLPAVDEWQKAFRGAITASETDPGVARRMTVWVQPVGARPSNIGHPDPEFDRVEPVGSYPDDRSPYGVMDLAGNVSEWSATQAAEPGMRLVLGANWGTPIAVGLHRIDRRNMRPDQDIEFGTGVRCARRAVSGS